MSESANVVYGRLKEAMYLSGHAFGRGGDWLDTLLSDDAWRTVGPGFADVNEFLRSIDLSPFAMGNRPELVKRIKQLQPEASNRAIANAVGADESTVRSDLRPPKQEPAGNPAPAPEAVSFDLQGHGEPAGNPAPAATSKPDPSAKSNAQRMQSSETNEWYTPPQYIDAARAVLGAIDLDPASSHIANETVKASQFYSVYDDGLNKPWAGRVWLNPPYGGKAGAFIDRLAGSYNDGDITAAIALVSSHSTDTSWFFPLWKAVLCFTYGRIHFISSSDRSKTAATHGSVFAYLGPDPDRFAAEFSQFGAVVTQWT